LADERERVREGVLSGIGAYGMWGLLPLFLHALAKVAPVEILGWRIIWSVPAAFMILAVQKETASVWKALRSPRIAALLTGSALLIGFNWALYVWAVAEARIVEASLGYFLNPLVNAALGVFLLGERLRRGQLLAFALAAAGVAMQAWAIGGVPWVALALCASFAAYGYTRRLMPVSGSTGFAAEVVLLAPVAALLLAWLALAGPGLQFGTLPLETVMLVLTGPATAIPLILFAMAAQRVRFATLGLLQFLAPTLQFSTGVALGEPVDAGRLASFALIWVGVAVYLADAVLADRAAKAQPS